MDSVVVCLVTKYRPQGDVGTWGENADVSKSVATCSAQQGNPCSLRSVEILHIAPVPGTRLLPSS